METGEDKGATIWARKTINSEVFFSKPSDWFKIWFYIVNKVNFKDNGKFKKSEGFMTYEQISSYTGTTKNQVHGFIRWAKKDGMLTTRKTTRGMYIKVLNYGKYQDLNTYLKTTQKSKQKPHRNHTINKNEKNEKNVEYPTNTLEIAKIIGQEPTDGLNRYLNETYKEYKFKAFTEYFVEKVRSEYKKEPTIATWMNWVRTEAQRGNLPRRDK